MDSDGGVNFNGNSNDRFIICFRPRVPSSSHPIYVSPTSTHPLSISRPGRTIDAAYTTKSKQSDNYPNTRCRPKALTPNFWLVRYHIAWNNTRSGLLVPSNNVPAVTDVWQWQCLQ